MSSTVVAVALGDLACIRLCEFDLGNGTRWSIAEVEWRDVAEYLTGPRSRDRYDKHRENIF